MFHHDRWRNPGTGRFVSADPFGGFSRQPLSLNKYTYAHNNPVIGADPSGLFFSLISSGVTTSIRTVVQNPYFAVAAKGYDGAQTLVDAIQIVGQFATTGTANPLIVAGLLSNLLPFGDLLNAGQIVGRRTGNLLGVTGPLTDALKGFKQTSGEISRSSVELVGSLGAIGTAKRLGFEAVENFPTRYRGFDGLFRDASGGLVIVEAKGGASRLGTTINSGGQLSQRWIERHISRLNQLGYRDLADELKAGSLNSSLSALLVSTPVNRAAETVGDPSFVLKSFREIGEDRF